MSIAVYGAEKDGFRITVVPVPKRTGTVSHLSSDGRVHHGEQGGGHLAEANSAHERGRDEADEVTDDASAEGEDDRVPRAAVREQEILEFGLGRAALALLAGRDDVGDPSRSSLGRDLCDGFFERAGKLVEVERCEVRVGKEDIGRRLERRQDSLDDVRDQVEAAMDRFTAGTYGQSL